MLSSSLGPPTSAITIAELLRDQGYHTVHIGKWHVRQANGMAPHTPLQATREDYEALAHIKLHRERVYAAIIRSLDRGVGQAQELVPTIV